MDLLFPLQACQRVAPSSFSPPRKVLPCHHNTTDLDCTVTQVVVSGDPLTIRIIPMLDDIRKYRGKPGNFSVDLIQEPVHPDKDYNHVPSGREEDAGATIVIEAGFLSPGAE